MSPFPDHFSGHAALYARVRPRYPAALFAWLAAAAPHRRLAWDAGTGNGQAAVALAAHFDRVVASDPSERQIAEAELHPAVRYHVAPAEASPVEPGSAALVTAAQAAHWFRLPEFFAAAREALAPGGVVALWGYELMSVTPAVDARVHHLYHETLRGFWPPQRALVEDAYRSIELPFVELAVPGFIMEHRCDLQGFLDYLRSWSAAQRFAAERGRDAVAEEQEALAAAWGDPARLRTVRFPLFVRAGRT